MTYPEMNKQIVRILRTYSEPDILYAANRIEELERQLEQIIGLWDRLRISRKRTGFRLNSPRSNTPPGSRLRA